MSGLTHLSLFSGLGGFDVAAESAGMQTVMLCEIDKHCRKVLNHWWPDVPIWDNVKTLTTGVLYEQTGLRTVDVISGGTPCQPASIAGKRRGKDDERWLWPDAIRVVREIKPSWAVFENPLGILTLDNGMAFESICTELENAGYEIQPYIIPACAVGAPHRRERVFIVAHGEGEERKRAVPPRRGRIGLTNGGIVGDANSKRWEKLNTAALNDNLGQHSGERIGRVMGNAECRGRDRQSRRRTGLEFADGCQQNGRGAESGLDMPTHGTPAILDFPSFPARRKAEQYEYEPPRVVPAKSVKVRAAQIKMLGNAVVWQQVAPIFAAIAAAERAVTT